MATGSVTADSERQPLRWRRLAGYASLGFMLGAVFVALTWFYYLQHGHDFTPNLAQIRFLDKVRKNGGEVVYSHDAHWQSKVSNRLYHKTGWRLPGTPSSPHVRGSEHISQLRLVGHAITDEELGAVQGFARLKELYLSETSVSDEGLKHLSGLNQLLVLVLEGPFTDAGLGNLSGLERLENLQLIGASVEGPGFGHLKELPGLRILSFEKGQTTAKALKQIGTLKSLEDLHLYYATNVTDSVLAYWSGLDSLRSLYLRDASISDAGLAHLSRLDSLRSLYLWDAPISDAGLAHLSRMENLKDLSLTGTKLTDAGLVHLGRLENLEYLQLVGNKINDAGLAHLTGLKNLQWLNLGNTNVTSNGARTLKQAMPKVRISR